MNMQALMQQAQRMQKDIMKKKEEVGKKIFESENEFVTVSFNGNKQLVSLVIKNRDNMDADDIEALEDMVKIAINDCLKKVDDEVEKSLGAYGSQLNGLF